MPAFPALPAVKLFRINGRLLACYLDTVEVRSSSLLVPTVVFGPGEILANLPFISEVLRVSWLPCLEWRETWSTRRRLTRYLR